MKILPAVLEVFCIRAVGQARFCVRAVGQARFLDQSALPMIVDSENFVERIEGVERKKEI